MIRGIAIETSGRLGSVAVVEDGKVIAEETFPHGLQHAARIVPVLDNLCRARSWAPRDLDELYVSAGPGSFTGLRIGITLAKTLALASELLASGQWAVGSGQIRKELATSSESFSPLPTAYSPLKLVAVPTVRVLAENAPMEVNHLIIVLDAKRDQIFTARFERIQSGWIEREPAHLDSLTAMLVRAPRPVYLLGEGIPFHRQFIPPDDRQIVLTDEQTWRARAAAVAAIGWPMARAGQWADPLALTPIYIRRPEAEEKLEGKK